MYGIVRRTFSFSNSNESSLEAHSEPVATLQEAEEIVEALAADWCKALNTSFPGVKEPPFRWDRDGSEEYDYVIRFWDGDDYRVVLGYKIFVVGR